MKLTNNLYFYPECGMMDCNTYVIKDEICVIIDPGSTQFLPELVAGLFKDGIDPKDIDIITNTHMHIDHRGANESFKELSGAEIRLHPLHGKFYDVTVVGASRLFGLQPRELKTDSYLDNSRLNCGKTEFEFIHCPGHTPDSICFYDKVDKFLICGDVIFSQNTGRVDLPGGSAEQLKQSIENLSQLEIEYLLPGHMNIVTGAEKVKRNFDFIKTHVFKWL